MYDTVSIFAKVIFFYNKNLFFASFLQSVDLLFCVKYLRYHINSSFNVNGNQSSWVIQDMGFFPFCYYETAKSLWLLREEKCPFTGKVLN